MREKMIGKGVGRKGDENSFMDRKIIREKTEKKIMEFIASKRNFLDEKVYDIVMGSENPVRFSEKLRKFSILFHVFDQAEKMLKKTEVVEDAIVFVGQVDAFVSEDQFSRPLSQVLEDYEALKPYLAAYATITKGSYTEIDDIKAHANGYVAQIREKFIAEESKDFWKKDFELHFRDPDHYAERIEEEAEEKGMWFLQKYGHVEGGEEPYKIRHYDNVFIEFRSRKEKMLNEKLETLRATGDKELLDKIALSWYLCDIMQTMYNRGKKHGAAVYYIAAKMALEKLDELVSEENFNAPWKEFYSRFRKETYLWMRAFSYLLMYNGKFREDDGRIRLKRHYFDFRHPEYHPKIMEEERRRVAYEVTLGSDVHKG